MKHLHFQSIDSTQNYLKKLVQENQIDEKNVLVSASAQSSGIGQKDKRWETGKNALAFSFSISPSSTPSLTPLEIGVLLRTYLNDKIKLKWPNDLVSDQGEKYGGIICHYINPQCVVVGVGINWGIEAFPNKNFYRYPPAYLFETEIGSETKEHLSLEIYQFILKNRLDNKEIRNSFLQGCYHINKMVTLVDGEHSIKGIFKEVGLNGEAIIQVGSETQSYLSGNLLI